MSPPRQVNRNSVWAELFVNELVRLGVTDVCISPGSRSTSLTLAFAGNSAMGSSVHVDERSCAFFGLGLARTRGRPVALVCTSGTAAAEFYPAVIEAYQSGVPLIVCTADRPPEARGTGANQTINQNNLYGNHIRWFKDVGVPDLSETRLREIREIAVHAVHESCAGRSGPVHLNFPFDKPFEPDVYTDVIDPAVPARIAAGPAPDPPHNRPATAPLDRSSYAVRLVTEHRRGLIVAGPNIQSESFHSELPPLAAMLGYPILADGASPLRYFPGGDGRTCTFFNGYLRKGDFSERYTPEVVLYFGDMFCSAGLEQFLRASACPIVHISPFHTNFDPLSNITGRVEMEPGLFCRALRELCAPSCGPPDRDWEAAFFRADAAGVKLCSEMVSCLDWMFEGKIVTQLLSVIPERTKLFVSNSMPMRDLDYFGGRPGKELTIFANRGASGIDGITSTALGIASASEEPVVLVTGDLAFYHDLNGLLAAKQQDLALTVVLVNNDGGGIFEMLPIASYPAIFEQFFATPIHLDFRPFVHAYGGTFQSASDWSAFRESLATGLREGGLHVVEVLSDRRRSAKLRKHFSASLLKEAALLG